MRDMLLSSLCFAAMAAVAKLVGERVPMQQIVLVRGVLCALLTFWWLRAAGVSWRGQRPGILVLRGALGYAALSCYFWSVHHLPLAEAILIQQTHPVFAAALAWLVLREPAGRRFAPALTLALAGVALLVQPGPAESFVGGWGVLVALSGAILSAGAYVAVRDASRTEHPMALVFWFPAVSVVLALPGTAVAGPVWPTAAEWVGLVFVALAGQLGQVFLTRGLYRVPAGRATLANPLTTLFGAFLGWAVFDERLGWTTLAGGLLLVAAVLLAGTRGDRPGRGETLSPG